MLKTGQISKKQTENATRIDGLASDTAAIKGHVNSEKTAADGRQTNLQTENALLREMLAEKANTASLLAQSVAQAAGVPATTVVVAPVVPVPPEQDPIHQAIQNAIIKSHTP